MFQFTEKQASNWRKMLEGLYVAKRLRRKYDITNSEFCPCGHYMRYIGKDHTFYDIDEVVENHFGVNMSSYGADEIEHFFTCCGPSTINKAIELGERILKQHAPPMVIKESNSKGKVKITNKPGNNGVLFTDLEIGQVFRYDGEIWMKSFAPDNDDDFAVCLNDGCNGTDWRGYFVELVDIEVVVSQ